MRVFGTLLHMESARNPINILCIGTTGMLTGLTRSLVQSGNRVHAIARTQHSLDRCAAGVAEEYRDRLVLHACDYGDPDTWARTLDEIPDPIDGVVCWVHSSAPDAFERVIERFEHADILRVSPSATSPIDAMEHSHRTVILGSSHASDTSRWLTHGEISQGVADAFWGGEKVSVVGSLEGC